MSNLLATGFVEIQCCGSSLGYVNTRQFTKEAHDRFREIQQALGNAWIHDAAANAILDDPASYAPPADGTPILFSCPQCAATFTWVDGHPARSAAS